VEVRKFIDKEGKSKVIENNITRAIIYALLQRCSNKKILMYHIQKEKRSKKKK